MSIENVAKIASEITADKHITETEMIRFLDRTDDWLSSPPSFGSFISTDEYMIAQDLSGRILRKEITCDEKANSRLNLFLHDNKPDDSNFTSYLKEYGLTTTGLTVGNVFLAIAVTGFVAISIPALLVASAVVGVAATAAESAVYVMNDD